MRFDRYAHSYDRYAGPQRLFASRLADFARVRPGESVLEVGAGTGALTGLLCAVSARVHATDASDAMIQLGSQAVPNAKWSRLDAFTEILPEAELQISSGLLQWAREPQRVLERWKRAVGRGRMVHAFPCEPCLAEWRSIVAESPFVWRNEAEWIALFEAAGLPVGRRALWTERVSSPSALDVARAMHRSGATGHPQLGVSELRHALREYEARFSDSSGTYATWVWLAIEALPQV